MKKIYQKFSVLLAFTVFALIVIMFCFTSCTKKSSENKPLTVKTYMKSETILNANRNGNINLYADEIKEYFNDISKANEFIENGYFSMIDIEISGNIPDSESEYVYGVFQMPVYTDGTDVLYLLAEQNTNCFLMTDKNENISENIDLSYYILFGDESRNKTEIYPIDKPITFFVNIISAYKGKVKNNSFSYETMIDYKNQT